MSQSLSHVCNTRVPLARPRAWLIGEDEWLPVAGCAPLHPHPPHSMHAAPPPSPPPQAAETASKLAASVGRGDAAGQRLALLCLGEIGRQADLSSLPAVEAAITAVRHGSNRDS